MIPFNNNFSEFFGVYYDIYIYIICIKKLKQKIQSLIIFKITISKDWMIIKIIYHRKDLKVNIKYVLNYR